MISQRVKELLADMSLEEKLGQMIQLQARYFCEEDTSELTGPGQKLEFVNEQIKYMGSVLNSKTAKQNITIQTQQMEKQPHHIPMLIMGDVIHGHATIFPIPLAIGATFNTEACKMACEISALECAVSGVHLTFSPMADLVRDSRWGRVMESYGEDPFLNSQMVKAAVEGYQGDSIKDFGKIASCVKHFAAYGASEAGREYNSVDMSEGTLREYYLPAYKCAVENGVKMVMTAFNIVDRVPMVANRHLLQDILYNEWKFKGVVISDFAAVYETIVHGYSKDRKQAAERAINAGCDIEMMSDTYLNYAEELISEGRVSIEQIDHAVGKILMLKEELGLFENPYKDASELNEKKYLLCDAHKKIARKISDQSIVLLENDGILPLKKDGLKIGIVGPFATSKHVFGAWAKENNQSVSLMEGINNVAPNNKTVAIINDELEARLTGFIDIKDSIHKDLETIKDCDVIIVAVGEHEKDSGEAASKVNLRLSENQEKLVYEAYKLEKPVIMVLFSGRPMEIGHLLPFTNAVLQGWFLGNEMGNALADVIFGDYNPSARLPITYPRSVGQLPLYYNAYNTGRPDLESNEKHMSKYIDCASTPLYPFGYGLSYSRFEYDNLRVVIEDDKIIAEIDVENKSGIKGKETVQCYVRDISGSVVRPVAELKAFQQIELNPYEKVSCKFLLTKEMLKFHNDQLEWVFESGEYEIMIGCNSSQTTKAKVIL